MDWSFIGVAPEGGFRVTTNCTFVVARMITSPYKFANRISFSRDVAMFSTVRDRVRNGCRFTEGNWPGPFAQQVPAASLRRSNGPSNWTVFSDAPFSIRVAIASSTCAIRSSNSRCATCAASGNSKPGSWRRYLRSAIRITNSARNFGCHSRIRLRNARSRCREAPNSNRTPSAEARVVSKFALMFSRREWLRSIGLPSSGSGSLTN